MIMKAFQWRRTDSKVFAIMKTRARQPQWSTAAMSATTITANRTATDV